MNGSLEVKVIFFVRLLVFILNDFFVERIRFLAGIREKGMKGRSW